MPPSDACPVCSGPLLAPQAILVCSGCADNVAITGAISVTSTAEFAAVVPAVVAAIKGGEAAAPPVAASCQWCGKAQRKVKKLISGGGVHICDECVALCAKILDAELGDGWR
jgi:hypothetical protein